MLSDDPRTVNPGGIKDIRAVMTMLGGRIVWNEAAIFILGDEEARVMNRSKHVGRGFMLRRSGDSVQSQCVEAEARTRMT